MPKVVWNGGLELDWKTVGVIFAIAFQAGQNWVQYRELRIDFKAHVDTARIESETLGFHGYRLGSLENRIDYCCPLYQPAGPPPKPLKPQDLAPPAMAPPLELDVPTP